MASALIETDPLAVVAAVEAALPTLAGAYHRLGIVAGATPSRLSNVLRALNGPPARARINVGEMLARELRECDPSRRGMEAPLALARIFEPLPEVALLDHIEALFLPSLALSVLDAFRDASRARTVIVAWPLPSPSACTLLAEKRLLSYATAGHPEYTAASIGDIPIWCVA